MITRISKNGKMYEFDTANNVMTEVKPNTVTPTGINNKVAPAKPTNNKTENAAKSKPKTIYKADASGATTTTVKNDKVVVEEPKKEDQPTTNTDLMVEVFHRLSREFTLGRTDALTISIFMVNKIRAIYFTNLFKPGGYDLEMITYMDKILFDPLVSVISRLISYSTIDGIPKEIVKQFITDALDTVEYQTDRKAMLDIIDAFYEVF